MSLIETDQREPTSKPALVNLPTKLRTKLTRAAYRRARRRHVDALCQAATDARHHADALTLLAQRTRSRAAILTEQATAAQYYADTVQEAACAEMDSMNTDTVCAR